MDFFRNPEIKRMLLLYVLMTVVISSAGFAFEMIYGVVLLAVCLMFIITALLMTYRRYKKIAGLSHDIDNILHGREGINFSEYAEGELSVLQSEISKMTVRLREQSNALYKDKVYLADSIADISHQIRTPLTSINLLLSFLSQQELDDKKRLELTRELMKMVERIDWLIVSLLKMSRLDAGTANMQRNAVEVSELITKAAEALAIPMELHEQRLEVCSSGNESFVGDMSWSTEAIGNVLKNCMEHTPAGGVITVETEENALYTQIVIRDTGHGIAEEDLPHLFERFYKGKYSNEQGFGIGLALARMIITKQNGTIKAGNEQDGGARFTIRFYKEIV